MFLKDWNITETVPFFEQKVFVPQIVILFVLKNIVFNKNT